MSLKLSGRGELKYFFPVDLTQEIRDFIEPFTELDPYAAEKKDHAYTVRSIYFDTQTFDFYYDKMDGLKIRKKLRVRVYNKMFPDKPAFLEIKRRYVNRVIKERAITAVEQVEQIHRDRKIPDIHHHDSVSNLNIMKKYIFNLENLHLVPTTLVAYEREAYIGKIDSHERVTIDKNLRSFIYPDFKDLFREDDLKPLLSERHILELKFDGYLPKWMGRLVRTFKLRAEPIPKYCLGAAAWLANKNDDKELRARQGALSNV